MINSKNFKIGDEVIIENPDSKLFGISGFILGKKNFSARVKPDITDGSKIYIIDVSVAYVCGKFHQKAILMDSRYLKLRENYL